MARAGTPAPVELPLEAEEFLSWLTAEARAFGQHARGLPSGLQAYFRWLQARSAALAAVGEPDVVAYVALRRSGKAPASSARALVVVQGLHRFLAEEGYAAVDPTADVQRPRVPPEPPKALSEDEIEALIGAVVGSDPIACATAILEVLYGTGLRISSSSGCHSATSTSRAGSCGRSGKAPRSG